MQQVSTPLNELPLLIGLSTDAKPTIGYPAGTTFYETDTTNTYIFTTVTAGANSTSFWAPYKPDKSIDPINALGDTLMAMGLHMAAIRIGIQQLLVNQDVQVDLLEMARAEVN